jgi:hypothetical protein
MRINDELIDETLRNNPSWQPSTGFAARVASASQLRRTNRGAAFWSVGNVAAVVPLAALTAAGGYFIGGSFDVLTASDGDWFADVDRNNMGLGVLSYAIAGWFVSRPHPVE